MKIKRYMAVSMRAALAQVRIEQGAEAVILSSRRVEEGIEVIAAVDYDEALFVDATRVRPPVPAADAAEQSHDDAPVAAVGAAPPSVANAKPRPADGAKPLGPVSVSVKTAAVPGVAGFAAVQREMKELRGLLEGGLRHMSWNDKRLRDPLQARVLEDLSAIDIAPDVAMALAELAPRRSNFENPLNLALALLVRQLPVVDLTPVNGGIVALIGPTGAGKTTTIAKLAARWSVQHGSKELALVSTDSYRIGAREQLATYARILGAPMLSANSGKELAQVLDRLKSKKLVLIDTAGMGPRDIRLTEQLSALQLGAAGARVMLTLPAQSEGDALEEIARSFARVSPCACIVTKIDEAASLGAVLSVALRHKLPIAYLCNGQRVPEDLHAAYQRKVWLARMAAKLKQNTLSRLDVGYCARNFGGASLHA